MLQMRAVKSLSVLICIKDASYLRRMISMVDDHGCLICVMDSDARDLASSMWSSC